MGGNVFLASCEFHFIKVHENLVQHPSFNIISIARTFLIFHYSAFTFDINSYFLVMIEVASMKYFVFHSSRVATLQISYNIK